MTADGGTPIGDAMIAGKRALDRTGLSRRHLLVVTDGENTDGAKPVDVMVVPPARGRAALGLFRRLRHRSLALQRRARRWIVAPARRRTRRN